jgi:hypothetical protein
MRYLRFVNCAIRYQNNESGLEHDRFTHTGAKRKPDMELVGEEAVKNHQACLEIASQAILAEARISTVVSSMCSSEASCSVLVLFVECPLSVSSKCRGLLNTLCEQLQCTVFTVICNRSPVLNHWTGRKWSLGRACTQASRAQLGWKLAVQLARGIQAGRRAVRPAEGGPQPQPYGLP